MAQSETLRILRAIRRLAHASPVASAGLRLDTIKQIVNGEKSPETWIPRVSSTLRERLEAGQKSRAKRNAFDKRPGYVAGQKQPTADPPAVDPEEEEETDEGKKRKRRGDRNRKESGGLNRSTDLNL